MGLHRDPLTDAPGLLLAVGAENEHNSQLSMEILPVLGTAKKALEEDLPGFASAERD